MERNECEKIEALFHGLILERAEEFGLEDFIGDTEKKLPPITEDLVSQEERLYYAVPGMYGGFGYKLEKKAGAFVLDVESWSRVVGGSGQSHRINAEGCVLTGKGFV